MTCRGSAVESLREDNKGAEAEGSDKNVERDGWPLEILESKWGPRDELGQANLLGSELVKAALAVVKNGSVLDLSQPLSRESPRLPVVQSPYTLCLWSNPASSIEWFRETEGAQNDVAFADERVELDLHTGTHIDALTHTWVGSRGYNGFTTSEAVSNWGLRRCGIEKLPPIVTRGILLDVERLRGRCLDPGEVVTAADLAEAASTQGVDVRPGDIVFIRTGWARYYGKDNDVYVGAAPGIGVEAARWCVSRDVVAVGSDTMGLEVYPAEREGVSYPVHQFLLAGSGVYIIEQANFEELSVSGVDEFACLCLAPAFQGATGSPVRLSAMF